MHMSSSGGLRLAVASPEGAHGPFLLLTHDRGWEHRFQGRSVDKPRIASRPSQEIINE